MKNNQELKKIRVEVFSLPGCSKCGRAKEVLCQVIEYLGTELIEWSEVNILQEMDYAVRLGLLTTPAIVIDGQLTFSGLPSSRKLQQEIESRLSLHNEITQT